MPTSAVFQLYRSVLYTQGYKIKIVFYQIVPSAVVIKAIIPVACGPFTNNNSP
jgi:hypothetical protein